jgi:uncharacterized protein (TIGR00159 family)
MSFEFVREIGISGFFDIAFMSLLIYSVLMWFKRTKATFVLIGIVIIGLVYLFARLFNLVLTAFVLQAFFAVILVAIIVIFQEELRQLFGQVPEKLRQFFEQIPERVRTFFERIPVWGMSPREKSMSHVPREIQTLAKTIVDLANKKNGALIVIHGKSDLLRHLDGGVDLNGEISEPLLKSIFDPNSLGHDGAVVIEKGRISKFSCHLPLSKNFRQLQNRGTRHAAALGLAELTDALCIVISEERGTISFARNGELHQVGTEQLILLLEDFYEEISPFTDSDPWHSPFTRNYKEKILAVIITLALWFVFVYGSNLHHQSFTVPIEYADLPSGYKVVAVEPKAVTVSFLGPRRAFYFFNEKEIRLFINVPNTSEGVKAVTLSESNLSFPKDITLERIEPRTVRVQIDEVKTEGN